VECGKLCIPILDRRRNCYGKVLVRRLGTGRRGKLRIIRTIVQNRPKNIIGWKARSVATGNDGEHECNVSRWSQCILKRGISVIFVKLDNNQRMPENAQQTYRSINLHSDARPRRYKSPICWKSNGNTLSKRRANKEGRSEDRKDEFHGSSLQEEEEETWVLPLLLFRLL
jgi:hypothetical protein